MAPTLPSREDLDSMIAVALAEYDEELRVAWARVRIEPAKWRCSPWGDADGGFWVVALEGDHVLWFNHIEDGFNRSAFSERGVIDEYSCNQTALSEILAQVAQAHGTHFFKKDVDEYAMPAELVGPGTIVLRRTTYWELRTATGSDYRAHFRDKVETAFGTDTYPRVEIVSRHPLLVQHEEPSRSLYFVGTAIDPRTLVETLDQVIRTASKGWRSIVDYSSGGVEARLRAGHGLLMDAPASVCAIAASALENAGVRTSILGNVQARGGCSALLLGRSYVIARTFVFEHRET